MNYEPDLIIKFGGAGNIKIETLTKFLEEYKKLLYIINAEFGYSEEDLSLEVSPPEKSSFKIQIHPRYKKQILAGIGTLAINVLGGIILYHTTKSENPEKANEIITNNENGKIINKIYNSEQGKQIVNQTFILVDNDENINGLELDKEGERLISLNKKEISQIVSNNENQDKESTEIETFDILNDKQTLILKTIHFEGQAKWAFIFKGYNIKATMNDEEFLKQMNNISFKKGDILTVILSRKRIYDEVLNTFIVDQNSYKIEKVLNHSNNAENSTAKLDF